MPQETIMSTSAMSRAVRRGIRRSLYLSATGDTSRLKRMREEVEAQSGAEIAWKNTGDRLSRSMGTMPETRGISPDSSHEK